MRLNKCVKIQEPTPFANEDKQGLDPEAPPPGGPEEEAFLIVLEGYGSPVVAPSGDVYTWMRTPTHYKILKWTWQD